MFHVPLLSVVHVQPVNKSFQGNWTAAEYALTLRHSCCDTYTPDGGAGVVCLGCTFVFPKTLVRRCRIVCASTRTEHVRGRVCACLEAEPIGSSALDLRFPPSPPSILSTPRWCFGTRKGRGGQREDSSRAHRLRVLGSAAAAIIAGQKVFGGSPLPLPAAPAAPPRTGGHGDDSGDGDGTRRHYNVVARGRREGVASMVARLGDEVSRQLEPVAAGEWRLNGSRQGSGTGGIGGGGGGRNSGSCRGGSGSGGNGSGSGGSGRGDDGGRGKGGMMLRLQAEARLLRAEEIAILAEVAERQGRVAALAEELCDVENAVEEVGRGILLFFSSHLYFNSLFWHLSSVLARCTLYDVGTRFGACLYRIARPYIVEKEKFAGFHPRWNSNGVDRVES